MLAALLLAASAVAAPHPVYEDIQSRSGALGPCALALAEPYGRIASVESAESSWAAQDLRDGTCRVAPLGAGGATYVEVSPAERDRQAVFPGAEMVAIVHVHPLDNAPYFADAAYAGEVMFADADAVAARRLSGPGWRALVDSVRAGRAPGFNLSPPSIQDLLVAGGDEEYNRGRKRVVNVVLTSGGAWTYSVPDPAKARKALEDLVVYANMYEVSRSPTATPARRERGRLLYENARMDPAVAGLIDAWAEASLGLRAPYSGAATAFLGAGEPSAVRREYADKLVLARRFCALLATLGVDATFEPF